MIAELQYPDLYFVYPVVNAAGDAAPSEKYFDAWQEMVLKKGAFFASADWLEALKADNSRPIIYTKDAEFIEQKLSLHISEGGYRMVLIYQPERMRDEMANKLLKLMEEPPQKTLFLSVTLDATQLLETVISRMQRIEIPLLSASEMLDALSTLFPQQTLLERKNATERAEGILLQAVNILSNKEETTSYTRDYSLLLRYIESREVVELKKLASEMASKGREYAIASLQYMLQNFRFALRGSVDTATLSSGMNSNEEKIECYTRGWISTDNIAPLYRAVEEAIAHIKGNVMSKLVLFDLFIQLSAILTPFIRNAKVAKAKQRG